MRSSPEEPVDQAPWTEGVPALAGVSVVVAVVAATVARRIPRLRPSSG